MAEAAGECWVDPSGGGARQQHIAGQLKMSDVPGDTVQDVRKYPVHRESAGPTRSVDTHHGLGSKSLRKQP